MYIQEISIEIKKKVDKELIVDEFEALMAYYRSNGQIQGKIQSQYFSDNKITCLPFTIEIDALSNKYNNYYVNIQSEKVESLCNSKLCFKNVGKYYESYNGGCKCKKRDFFILMTNYISINSPIICGNCNKSVPLYKIPVIYDYGYMPILSWETNYISCDCLQMNCEVGERWGLNQMQDINSQLTKQGIVICDKIKEVTSIPTYYYLHNYKKYKRDQFKRTCPSCNNKWDLKKQLHNFYDFKCDKCRLISTISTNS